MTESQFSPLYRALSGKFPDNEAKSLAVLMESALKMPETIYYQEIPIEDPLKNDTLLLAFEERILIPVRSRQSPAWDDRVHGFIEGEMFFMPRFVRALFEDARQSGVFNSETAVRRVLAHQSGEHVDDVIRFLKEMKPHVNACMAEGGLMAAVARGAGLGVAVNDIVDACVIVGIMSPCTRGSSVQGLIWYEINPCLYWDERFA